MAVYEVVVLVRTAPALAFSEGHDALAEGLEVAALRGLVGVQRAGGDLDDAGVVVDAGDSGVAASVRRVKMSIVWPRFPSPG